MGSGGISYDQMADFINGTYQRIEKGSILQIAQTYNDYPWVRKLFDENRLVVKSGRTIARNLIYQPERVAYHTKPYGNDVLNQSDVTVRQEVPWRRTTRPIIFEMYEDILNSGEDEIFDTMKTKEINAALDMAEIVEEAIASKPADSNDTETPWGVPMFIVTNATEGFNGGNPTGFASGVVGIDRSSASYAKLKNYTGTFTGYDFGENGIVRFCQRMADKTKFTAPSNDAKGVKEPMGQDRMYLCNYNCFDNLRNLLRSQNDDLGKDLDPFSAGGTMRQSPILWWPQLDSGVGAVSADTIYQMDWKWIYPVVTRGVEWRRHPARPHPNKHTAMVVWIDLQWNMYCENARRLGVGYKV